MAMRMIFLRSSMYISRKLELLLNCVHLAFHVDDPRGQAPVGVVTVLRLAALFAEDLVQPVLDAFDLGEQVGVTRRVALDHVLDVIWFESLLEFSLSNQVLELPNRPYRSLVSVGEYEGRGAGLLLVQGEPTQGWLRILSALETNLVAALVRVLEPDLVPEVVEDR